MQCAGIRPLRDTESHTKIQGGGFAKNEADESGRGQHRRAIWRTGYAADRADIRKQTVRSDWRGRSRTRKIEEEVSQKSEADETGQGPHMRVI